jgi:hydrogenase nickel incorporation protein HypA/HybF
LVTAEQMDQLAAFLQSRTNQRRPPRQGGFAVTAATSSASKTVCQTLSRDLSCHDWISPARRGFVFIVHELSIMQGALGIALEQAQKAGAERVVALRLRIGALSGVVPDALQFAFEALAPGTPAEGARLIIEDVPARFWCMPCNREFQAEDLFSECPNCHTPSGDLRAGREMEVASMEID